MKNLNWNWWKKSCDLIFFWELKSAEISFYFLIIFLCNKMELLLFVWRLFLWSISRKSMTTPVLKETLGINSEIILQLCFEKFLLAVLLGVDDRYLPKCLSNYVNLKCRSTSKSENLLFKFDIIDIKSTEYDLDGLNWLKSEKIWNNKIMIFHKKSKCHD